MPLQYFLVYSPIYCHLSCKSFSLVSSPRSPVSLSNSTFFTHEIFLSFILAHICLSSHGGIIVFLLKRIKVYLNFWVKWKYGVLWILWSFSPTHWQIQDFGKQYVFLLCLWSSLNSIWSYSFWLRSQKVNFPVWPLLTFLVLLACKFLLPFLTTLFGTCLIWSYWSTLL